MILADIIKTSSVINWGNSNSKLEVINWGNSNSKLTLIEIIHFDLASSTRIILGISLSVFWD